MYVRGATMKRAKMLTIICILALSVIVALAAQAGQFGWDHNGHGTAGFYGLRVLRQLDLSDQQKEVVSDILKKYAEGQDKVRESVQAGRQQMAALMMADEFDETSIRQTFQETSAAMEEAVVLRARIFAEIKAVLNDDQRAQLIEMQRNREERMAQRKRHGKSRRADHDTSLQRESE
jgi:Spy/CpxP family protein refolding chaperone